MATRTEAPAKVQENTVMTPCDPWTEEVEVVLIRQYPKQKYRTITVNGRSWKCKTNTPISVPRPIADRIAQLNKSAQEYEEFLAKLESEGSKQI